ncbi:MAG: DNA polymerase/3'-5' exonuclease PolX [Solirubrobacteraceae bacterium]|jgi:DNA polymerase (family 10)|nr:DNA polymerase/3'-5' exonuclease PolX [Solirubrobacteraceae bacterium]
MADPTNSELAGALDELGDLYELDGAIVHRVVAYRTAAKAIRESPVAVAGLVREGRVTELPGVGKTLEEKLTALLETGTIPAAEKLRATFPAGVVAMTKLDGVGPKKARRLHEELGVDSLEALRAAAEAGRVRELKGFGPKAEAAILAALDAHAQRGDAAPRLLLPKALDVAERILAGLRASPAVERAEVAGSARRGADDVKDLDIVVASEDPAAVAEAFAALDAVGAVQRGGAGGARGVAPNGLAVDLRVVPPATFGNLLQHFTGSKEHNVRLREQAVRRGLHVSEHGILDDASGETTRCATEEEVYARLGLPYPEPELRLDRGELDPGWEAPELVTLADLRGDLHCHTVASDGLATIEQMALAARERGHAYLAITDHSATHGFGNDVSPDALRRQIELVREVDARLEGIRVLAGTEVNVLPDGSPDYADDLLEQLDWVVASVHTAFRMSAERMTERIVRAVEHPLVDALGHPTGRLIGRRPGYGVDLAAVIDAAARTGTFLEINGQPDRRDLDDVHARAAADAGVGLVLDSDAHRPETLANQRWAVLTARRAALTAGEVANTLAWDALEARRPRHRTG